jgi:hypothetical protein
MELGVTNLPDYNTDPLPVCLNIFKKNKLVNKGWDGRLLQTDDDCERAIYYVSSKGKNSGYSLPSDICRAAKAMGLNATVYLGNKLRQYVFSNKLVQNFPNEITETKNLGVSVNKYAMSDLKSNQRALSALVRTDKANKGALHYVMRRPDNTFMDPDTAADHKWETFKYHKEPSSGDDIKTAYTGVSIVISS